MASNSTPDVTRLVTPAQYARDNNITRQTVYNRLRSRSLNGEEIAGRKFVKLT